MGWGKIENVTRFNSPWYGEKQKNIYESKQSLEPPVLQSTQMQLYRNVTNWCNWTSLYSLVDLYCFKPRCVTKYHWKSHASFQQKAVIKDDYSTEL